MTDSESELLKTLVSRLDRIIELIENEEDENRCSWDKNDTIARLKQFKS